MPSKAELQRMVQQAMIEEGIKTEVVRLDPEVRLQRIAEMTNLEELRSALRSAYSKRNKATTEEQDERYGNEIGSVQDRMSELEAIIKEAKDPLVKAVEFGETVDGVVQRLLNEYRDIHLRYKKWLHWIHMTQKQAKPLLEKIPVTKTPEEISKRLSKLGHEYLVAYEARAAQGDRRVQAINRTLLFIQFYTPEYVFKNIKVQDGRGQFMKDRAASVKKVKQTRRSKNG